MRNILLVVHLSLFPIILLSNAVEVDEILTDKHSFKVDTSISYSNIKREDGVSAPFEYQTQNGDFVTIPTYIGDTKSNQDYLNYSFNLKYGINKDFEIFSLLNFYTSDTHFSNNGNFKTRSDRGFSSWVLGSTYQLKSENKTPAILIGATIDGIERVNFSNTQHKNFNFKGYRFFGITHYTVDPLVFLLRLSYRYSGKKEYKEKSINGGEQFSVSPQFYFAVNPYSSLNAGIKYSFTGKSRIDNKIVSNSGSNMAYTFGTSYEINSKVIFNIDAEYSKQLNISQNTVSMGLSYKF
jgi:opacity protein-like surface antigen